MKYIILLTSISLAVIGQIFLKTGLKGVILNLNIDSLAKILLSPLIIFGFILYALSSILWLFVLNKFPLSIAAPLLNISYVILFLYGTIFLKETKSLIDFIGIGLIIVGVVFLNLGKIN